MNRLASDAQGRLYVGGSDDAIEVISSTNFSTLRSIDLPLFTSSAGDIHINGNALYYAANGSRLLTVNLTNDRVTADVSHGISSLFGLHSEGGRLYALAGNDVYVLNPRTGASAHVLDLPVSITVNDSATLAGVRINGTSRDDVLQADANGSKVYGLAGNDILIGSQVADRLEGGSGRDFLHGRGGNDTILGGAGNDVISGGAGNDRIDGGRGRDILEGGAGNDILRGGAGADSFVFEPGHGRDLIVDFQNNVDTLEFSVALMGSRPKTVSALLQYFATDTQDGVLFDFGSKGKVLLEDFTRKAQLADDILLY